MRFVLTVVILVGVSLSDTDPDVPDFSKFDFSGGEVSEETSVECPSGAIADNENAVCLLCADGTYEVNNTECVDCEIGSYNAEEGATHCVPCPLGHSTFSEGSYSAEQCADVCVVPDVKFSKSVEPSVDSRLPPDTLVKIMCNEGYQISNLPEARAVCSDAIASCTSVTVSTEHRSVTAGDSVTATCNIVTGVAPDSCTWYNNDTLLFSDGATVQVAADTYECVHYIPRVEYTVNIICTVRIQDMEEASENRATVVVTPCPDCNRGTIDQTDTDQRDSTTNMLVIWLTVALLIGIIVPVSVKVCKKQKEALSSSGTKYGSSTPDNFMTNIGATTDEGNPYPPRVHVN